MSASDPVIRLEGVSKAFEVFRTPRARMMATLGLPVPRGVREEFVAVQDVDLVVGPGERVGLVGRNGAGKSTILKMVAGLLRPTTGVVEVHGEVKALMELGTGFHPDFTGRQNVFASLAYQGISGDEAQMAYEDVLDFTELDEFMERPVKTYSAGMYARLAFATATAVRPEVLIVDEILGAGDAYFAQKSSRRMQSLTSQGTTLLFVSHDISAVQMMCDRAVWIDRGRIIGDDLPYEISKRYAASIRRQSELRLRAENLKLLRSQIESLDATADDQVVVRIVAADGGAIAQPVHVYEIAAVMEGIEIDRVEVGGPRDNDAAESVHLLTAPKYMNWSEPKKERDGRRYRDVGEFGGIYQHSPFVITCRGVGALQTVELSVVHGPVANGSALAVEQYLDTGYRRIAEIPAGPSGTVTCRLVGESEAAAAIEQEALDDADARYGTDPGAIVSVSFFGDDGQHRFVYDVGESFGVRIEWILDEETTVTSAVWVVCVYGLDGRCVSQVLSPPDANLPGKGVVTALFSPSRIGAGDYLVSVGLFDGLGDGNPGAEDVVCVLDRSFKLRVTAPPASVERGLVLQEPSWEVNSGV
jgi:lipopolysaccharide transport system ATP-binding protein